MIGRVYSDILIRVRPSLGGDPDTYPVEAIVDGSGLWLGAQANLPAAALAAVEDDPETYGRMLWEGLFGDVTLQRALDTAMGRAEGRVRIRLLMEENVGAPHSFCWERLRVRTPNGEVPAAATPDLPFSRLLPLEQVALSAVAGNAFHLLLAVASPSDLKPPLKSIDTEKEILNLRDAWEPLVARGQLRITLLARLDNDHLARELEANGWKIHQEAVTLDALSNALRGQHGIHLVAHGKFQSKTDTAFLLLETLDGQSAVAGQADLVARLRDIGLRLVFLESCSSAVREAGSLSPFSGLAQRLVEAGIPAVLAMQDYVRMEDAQQFAQVFYRSLLEEGQVDAAANRGRQALYLSKSRQWSIPALYSRLRDSKLWESDPLREAVLDLAACLQRRPDVSQPFPLEVIRSTAGLQYDKDRGPAGPRLPMLDASLDSLEATTSGRGVFVLLAGSNGRGKTAQLHSLYAVLARRYLDGGPIPLLVKLNALVKEDLVSSALLAKAINQSYEAFGVSIAAEQVERRLQEPLILLIDGDDDIGSRGREVALRNLEEFRMEFPGHPVYLTFDEAVLPPHALPSNVTVLVVQLMQPAAVLEYLENLPGKEGKGLKASIQSRSLLDIACVPWLLSKLLNHARNERTIVSRSGVIGRIVQENMAQVDWPAGLYSRAQEAIGQIAWQLQVSRRSRFPGAPLYEVLAEVRGKRDVSLDRFRETLIESRILCPSDEDGVRFAYPGFLSYFCAKYLQQTGVQMDGLIEDITATLGRLSRLRSWQDTLIFLAGILDSPDRLVRKILAGSSLVEGGQVFLAAVCVNEAALAGNKVGDDVREQLTDALIWRSHPRRQNAVSVRKKAVEALGHLRETKAIPHLVSLALDRVRIGWGGNAEFDYSGVRLAAVLALLPMADQTSEYIRTRSTGSDGDLQCARLVPLLDAWRRLDSDALVGYLRSDDPSLSAIAAFALSALGGNEHFRLLLELLLAPTTNDDTRWAVADSMLTFNPIDVSKRAVEPMLAIPELAVHAAYLIGMLGTADPDGPQCGFLRQCLKNPMPRLQGAALCSLAQLGIEDIRKVCEQLATARYDQMVGHPQFAFPENGFARDRDRLRYYSLESLRHIGNADSIQALRGARLPAVAGDDGDSLLELSYEVSEEIYWRLTGGLSGDAYEAPDSSHKSR